MIQYKVTIMLLLKAPNCSFGAQCHFHVIGSINDMSTHEKVIKLLHECVLFTQQTFELLNKYTIICFFILLAAMLIMGLENSVKFQ